MGHGDGEEIPHHIPPVIERLVVEVCPVEAEERKVTRSSWVREVDGLVRVHGHEHLHEREEPREDPLVRVLLNLVARLGHGNAAALELHVDERHAVDEQHHIAAPIVEKSRRRFEARLLGDLINAPTRGDITPIVNVEAHFLAEVQRIIGIVALDGNGLAVDETVELHRRAQRRYLLEYLLHLAVCQATAIEPVDARIVLVEDLCPVGKEILLAGLVKHATFPAEVLKPADKRGLEIRLILECVRHEHRILTRTSSRGATSSASRAGRAYADEG